MFGGEKVNANNYDGQQPQQEDGHLVSDNDDYGTSSPPNGQKTVIGTTSGTSNHHQDEEDKGRRKTRPNNKLVKQHFQLHIRPRVLYSSIFVWFSLTGGRFVALQLQQEGGLSDTQIGICFALQTILSSVCVVWSGSFADHLERKIPGGLGRAIVISVGVLLSSIAFWLQPLHSSYFFLSTSAAATPANHNNYRVYWYVTMRCLYSMAFTCTLPVLDGLTLDYLANANNKEDSSDTAAGGGGKEDYGKERLYGAIFWAITNLIMGPSLDYFGFSILYPYSVVAAATVWITLFLFTKGHQQQHRNHHHNYEFEKLATTKEATNNNNNNNNRQQEEEEHILHAPTSPGTQRRRQSRLVEIDDGNSINNNNNNNSVPFQKILQLICCGNGSGSSGNHYAYQYFGMAFMIAIFCLSIGTSVVESLVFLYFESLGSSYTLCSCTVLLTVVFEIPIFHIGPELLKRYGTTNLFLAACFCYMTRVIGYSLVPDGRPWWVLLMEPLHGVTYACASISSVQFVAESLDPYKGYDATGQAILSSLKGCGNVIGLLFGGIGEDLLGPRTMYRVLAAVVTLGFTLLYLGSRVHQRPDPTPHKANKQPNFNEDDESYQRQFIS